MLVEGICKKGGCPVFIVNELLPKDNPQCPTCKGYDTFWINDESHADDEVSIEEED